MRVSVGIEDGTVLVPKLKAESLRTIVQEKGILIEKPIVDGAEIRWSGQKRKLR